MGSKTIIFNAELIERSKIYAVLLILTITPKKKKKKEFGGIYQ